MRSSAGFSYQEINRVSIHVPQTLFRLFECQIRRNFTICFSLPDIHDAKAKPRNGAEMTFLALWNSSLFFFSLFFRIFSTRQNGLENQVVATTTKSTAEQYTPPKGRRSPNRPIKITSPFEPRVASRLAFPHFPNPSL